MSASIIDVRGVAKHYGAVRAVDGVDLAVGRGELFGLIGHNGAGKSTLFRLMLGLLQPSTGAIRIDGTSVLGRAARALRRHIGYLPEQVVFYDNLTGLETLAFFARLKRVAQAECPAALARVGLGDAARRRVREYSKGMRQRLGLAQALLGRPRLLLLDEPTSGLDPAGIRDTWRLLAGLRTEGVTTLVSSHVLAEIQERVDRLAIMENGRIRACGTVAELREATDLPLRFEVRAQRQTLSSLGDALARLGIDSVRADGEWLVFECLRPVKMAALGVLAAAGGAVLDVHVREPALEDVFLGGAP